MNHLHVNQIEKICQYVLQCQLEDEVLEKELIDHLCCLVEEGLNRGLSFSEALRATIQNIEIPEIQRVSTEVEALRSYSTLLKKDIRKYTRWTISGALSLGFLIWGATLFSFPLFYLALGAEGFTWMSAFRLIRKVKEKKKFDQDLILPLDFNQAS